eukprot:m.11202 g.11202  ORF g.11202 m.11202 type:complete len:221 (-) comp8701_c0_seq1:332-994(-)
MVAMSAKLIPSIEEASNLSRAERNRLSAMRSRERTKSEIKNLEGRVCVAIERKKQLASSVSLLNEECDRIEELLKKSLVQQSNTQPQPQPRPRPQLQNQSQTSAFEDWMLNTDKTDTDFVDFDLDSLQVPDLDLNQERATTASATSTATITNPIITSDTVPCTLPPPPQPSNLQLPQFHPLDATMLGMLDMTESDISDVVMDPAISQETIASFLPDLFSP